MPDPAPAENQVAAQQPAAESAAAPQPAVVRGPSGRFQRARDLPSLSERMAAKERELAKAPPPAALPDDAGDTESDDAAEPAASEGDTPPPPKPKRETVEVDKTDKPESFTEERVKFAEWKRRQREAHEAQLRTERQKFEEEIKTQRAQFEEERTKFTPRMEKAEKVLQLMEAADYEALAKEAGYEDWDKFQGHVIGAISDPNYKRTRELERQLQERDAREKKEREERETREKTERDQAEQTTRQRQRAEAIANHKQGLSAAMAKSQDRAVAAMADDPVFINTVYEIQRQNYDPSTNSTVTPEQAIRMAMKGAPRTLLEELTMLKDRLNKALGDAAATPAAPAAPAEPARKAPKTAVVPSSATVEPAGPGKFKGPKDPQWREYAKKRMEEAEEEEERVRLERKAARRR